MGAFFCLECSKFMSHFLLVLSWKSVFVKEQEVVVEEEAEEDEQQEEAPWTSCGVLNGFGLRHRRSSKWKEAHRQGRRRAMSRTGSRPQQAMMREHRAHETSTSQLLLRVALRVARSSMQKPRPDNVRQSWNFMSLNESWSVELFTLSWESVL